MIAASHPESTWKSNGGLILTRSNGCWWSSITNVMVKSTDFWVSGMQSNNRVFLTELDHGFFLDEVVHEHECIVKLTIIENET